MLLSIRNVLAVAYTKVQLSTPKPILFSQTPHPQKLHIDEFVSSNSSEACPDEDIGQLLC